MILCAFALMMTAMSYAQLQEAKKIPTVTDAISVFTQEFDLSSDQLALVKEYIAMDKKLLAKGLAADAIATQKEAFKAKISGLLPEGVMKELALLDKTKQSVQAPAARF